MSKTIKDELNNWRDCKTNKSLEPPSVEDRISKGLGNVNQAMGGLLGTTPPSPSVTFNKAPGEKVINNGDAYIVFGQDRPGIKESGFGGQGLPSPTIDLVVGRMGGLSTYKEAKQATGPCDGMFVGNSFAADAARIYISRLTQIDKHFGIAQRQFEEDRPLYTYRSGIAIKADKVRIIGREGVKIVTGKMQGATGYGPAGERNSVGGKVPYHPRIDLIAGNEMSSKWIPPNLTHRGDTVNLLQPVVKGENMVKCMQRLSEIIQKNTSYTYQVTLILRTVLGVLGIDPYRSWVPGGTSAANSVLNQFGSSPLYSQKSDIISWQKDFLEPRGAWQISSDWVYAT
jgi:hypothetical protein